MKTRHKIMSFLLSGAMVFSLLPASAIGTVKAASVNYALTATATASGSETSAFGPEKAKDGDATTKTSRWASEERDASESNPHWLAMDLGEVKTVNSVIITWERRNPTNYAIETSEDGSTWKAVKTFTSAPAEKEQIINLDNPVQTRYIRVRINTFRCFEGTGLHLSGSGETGCSEQSDCKSRRQKVESSDRRGRKSRSLCRL